MWVNIACLFVYVISIFVMIKGLSILGKTGGLHLRKKGIHQTRIGIVGWLVSTIMLSVRISLWFLVPFIAALIICVILYMIDTRGRYS
ncbi:hypothetical protein PPSC2_27440 (plasmid) [Paenibacillus polymyxa SC2]|uniref:Uncharacterized protein n=1 Tax=Paenibacillus polymyxa (strain SC2) TaxID=886882 RepID=A0A0D5ZCB5_PAEPS|nr:hypothetical protein PPSC2_27440 [Paenibacillus polymyxa SC2]